MQDLVLVGFVLGSDLVELCAAQLLLADAPDPCSMTPLSFDQLCLLGLSVPAIPFQLSLLSVWRIRCVLLLR